jgi:hypothetical protein
MCFVYGCQRAFHGKRRTQTGHTEGSSCHVKNNFADGLNQTHKDEVYYVFFTNFLMN